MTTTDQPFFSPGDLGSRASADLLDQDLVRGIAQAARHDSLLVAMDFDGTLSPLVGHPQDARMLPLAQAALVQLANAPKTTVALVSGRNLESLREVAAPTPDMVLVGSHGAEIQWQGQVDGFMAPLSADQARLVANLTAALEEVARENPGSRVEVKPAGAVLHYRNVSPAREGTVIDGAALVQAQFPQAHVTLGKKVVEFSAVSSNKGQALALLKARLDVDVTVFAGDDVTDENGFKVLGGHDLGIKVGPGESLAPWRVEDPEALADALVILAQARI